MDHKKVYWFSQPYMPEMKNIAVSPKIDIRDGRLCFSVPDSGIWCLTGKVISDTGNSFEFKCDDRVMGARGGTYLFTALDIKTFRREIYKWISQGADIAAACKDTNDLYYWYRKNWPNTALHEIWQYEMEQNIRMGRRTDT